jgi:hypothetical protein
MEVHVRVSAIQARTSGVLWVDRLSRTICTSWPSWGSTAIFRKSRKSAPFRVGLQCPVISPVPTFRAANRFVVPCRT